MSNWEPSDLYWLIWFVLAFLFFIAPETRALITGHPEHTLSAAIWRLMGYTPQHWGWNAFRFLFNGVFLTLFVWLYFHFEFHLFT